MKGYKVFNEDWTCRGFQYEVGKEYVHRGNIELCGSGFHFCRQAADCFKYYTFDSKNKVAEVEAIGLVESDGDKSVTDKIKIIKELTWHEVLELVNTGKDCTGLRNSGDWNSGNRNSGNRNSGNWNSGNRNSGDWNSGNSNSGDWNSGNWNSGNRNSGNWNSGNSNSGMFNTSINPKIKLFDKVSDLSFEKARNIKGIQILNWNFENNWWIYSENMTEQEKKDNPYHETLGGYLKTVNFKDACKIMWDKLSKDEKEEVKKIPNFDSNVFYNITGIKA